MTELAHRRINSYVLRFALYVLRFTFYVLLLTCSAGCAFTDPQNTPLLTKLDEHVQPETAGAKALLAPLFIPVGTGAALLDMFLLHPIQVVPASWRATCQMLWQSEHPVFLHRTMLFVPRAVVTPGVFVAQFLYRSAFQTKWYTPARAKPQHGA